MLTRVSINASAAARWATWISFVRETEQLGFTEAVEALGQRFNIVIEYEAGSGGPSREERSLRQEIFEIHDLAAEHYHQASGGRRARRGIHAGVLG